MRKNILLSLFAVMLAVGLLMASMLYQRYSDSERLSYLTTLPPYTGHLSHTLPVQTTKPALSDAPDVQFYDAEGKSVAYAPGELTAEQLEYGIRMCMDSE